MYKYICIALLLAFSMPAAAATVAKEIKLDSKVASMHKAGVGPVIYPHALHEKLYKCNDCHPKIFKDKHGDNDISMKKNMDGNFCGSPNCHNSQKAFALFNCNKCHTEVTGKPK